MAEPSQKKPFQSLFLLLYLLRPPIPSFSLRIHPLWLHHRGSTTTRERVIGYTAEGISPPFGYTLEGPSASAPGPSSP